MTSISGNPQELTTSGGCPQSIPHVVDVKYTWFRLWLRTGFLDHDGAMAVRIASLNPFNGGSTAPSDATPEDDTRRPRHPEMRRGVRQPFDRRELERGGWRTTLEYRENLVRSFSGRLVHVDAEWRAEGERVSADGEIRVVHAVGQSPASAWSRLRTAADLSDVHHRRTGS
jgi:hypothetical protein